MQPTDFKVAFPDASKGALDLLQRMLQFDPRKRISVDEALRHPWLAALHDEAAEPVAQGLEDGGGSRIVLGRSAGKGARRMCVLCSTNSRAPDL